MKAILGLILISMISLSASAEVYQPDCLAEAKKAVTKQLKTNAKNIKYFNAAIVGDGAASTEVITFTQKSPDSTWAILMGADFCIPMSRAIRID